MQTGLMSKLPRAASSPGGGPSRTRRRASSRRGPSCRACATATCATASTATATRRPPGSGRNCPGGRRSRCAARGTAARPSRMAPTPRPPNAAPRTAAATSSPSGSCAACPRGCATRSRPQWARKDVPRVPSSCFQTPTTPRSSREMAWCRRCPARGSSWDPRRAARRSRSSARSWNSIAPQTVRACLSASFCFRRRYTSTTAGSPSRSS